MTLAAVSSAWRTHAERGAEFDNAGEEQKWAAAEEYEKAHEAGASERDIAEVAEKSDTHIHFMRHALAYRGKQSRTFAECYAAAKKGSRGHDPSGTLITPPMPEGIWPTITADPPWPYDNRATRAAVGKERTYATMSVEDICDLEPPAADDAHLYLWTTSSFLREAFDVMEAWDFTYKTTLVWVKPQMGIGNYFRSCHELILFGLRGKQPTLSRDQRSWFEAPRGRHSGKPEAFLNLVERSSPGPYLELFGRPGPMFGRDQWTVLGGRGVRFACYQCHKERRPAVIRFQSDQFVIEVAAKRSDGQERARQVSTLTFCRQHAEAYVEAVGRHFGRHRELPPELLGHQGSMFGETA